MARHVEVTPFEGEVLFRYLEQIIREGKASSEGDELVAWSLTKVTMQTVDQNLVQLEFIGSLELLQPFLAGNEAFRTLC